MVTRHRWMALGSMYFAGLLFAGCQSKLEAIRHTEGAPVVLGDDSPELPVEAGEITITSATFGGACGAAPGNHTSLVAEACNGKDQCAFFVTNPGKDPFPGCAKDFSVQYRCDKQAATRQLERPPVQGENYTVVMSCR
jgi:hypothetical protein